MRSLLKPSSAAPAALVAALCTFNWLVKSTGNSLLISVPLFASLVLVASSLLNLKKNQPRLSAKLFLLGATAAVLDFLTATSVLKLMLSNSIVTVLSAVSAGISFINTLYSRKYSKTMSCILANMLLLWYTTTMEKFEVTGCVEDFEDVDTKIVSVCVSSSFLLTFIIPIRVCLSVEHNKEEHVNTHLSLSLALFFVCAGQTLLNLRAFEDELAAIGKSAVVFAAGLALLAVFHIAAVSFWNELCYAAFVRAYLACISLVCALYLFDSPDCIFGKNALESEFFVFYLPLFVTSLFLFVTPERLGELWRSTILDDLRIPTILAYYGHIGHD